jgi:hypothetical protein
MLIILTFLFIFKKKPIIFPVCLETRQITRKIMPNTKITVNHSSTSSAGNHMTCMVTLATGQVLTGSADNMEECWARSIASP